MATLNQLAGQIRFQLEQLSPHDGHHGFEHLCRHLARARICSNILPATGPVSAYGDQGRDFETFRTYLHESPIANSSFVGLASQGPIAFACTLTQKSKIKSKIESDVETIMGEGTLVIDIHYFCTTDVSVGLRHSLQKWAKEDHQVLLEIHDGQAISEDLTDQDTFWIAVQYLSVPAELYPAPQNKDSEKWYFKLVETWKQAANLPENYADFSEMKAAIRHATFTDTAKKDLPFWIEQMELLINSTPFDALKRKGTYEIAVASLRGLGSMIGYEEQLLLYFDKVPELTAPVDIEDATTLWNYCSGAHRQNAIQVTLESLDNWRSSIVDKIESELRASTQPGKRCLLLETRGQLYMVPEPEKKNRYTINKTIASWLELALLVDKAPLFPLENFADHLTQFLELPIIGTRLENHPDFSKLTQQIDELLAKRHGGFVAAEKCRDRAMVFYKRGEILRAIKEVHKAKIQWFAEETLQGALLATLFVSSCYKEIGLVFAAKYYALATAFIALNSANNNVQPLISRGLHFTAACDYSIGAYCGFFDFTDVSLMALNSFSKPIDTLTPEHELSDILFKASVIRTLTKRLNPDLLRLVDDRIKNWQGLENYFDDLIPEAEREWNKRDFSDIWLALEEQTYDRPFSDLGLFRSIQFNALGVTWRFKWENTYELTSIVEEIVAVVQIILADIAGTDWYLLRTTVEVEISFGESKEFDLEEIPSNDLGRWRLALSNTESMGKSDLIALQLASTLLSHASLLPTEQFDNRIEAAFRDGLSHKIFFGQPYNVLYRKLIHKNEFESTNRSVLSNPESDRPFKPVLHHQLSWYSDLGSGYTEESAKKALKNRYENSVRPIKYTLKRLAQQQSFIDAVHFLRAQGWLDWHILNATSLIVLNHHVNKEISVNTDREKHFKRFKELSSQPEDVNADSVPVSEFSVENLRFHLWISMQSTLKNLGFELHQTTPDFEAISDFLGTRYKYWTDDIDHPDYGF
ncbi:MAG: hypothetical protein HN686_00235 [Bacteroidetes bacterium]|jgi:hypothetical protein|nr:hypothetical protein [Anaerolineae bacterium]MBT7462383.1 hypothetical protein [Bacteroidota bacterium]